MLSQSDSTLGIANGKQLTPPPLPHTIAISYSASSNSTIKKLERSKTTVGTGSSFTSTDTSKNDNPSKMKRSKTVSRYTHTIEGSSQDISVDVEDTGKLTNLSQTSKEYRRLDTGQNEQGDAYNFPGGSEPTVITKKVPAKTTMENLNSNTTKNHGKAGKIGRSRTMGALNSSPAAPPQEKRRRGSDAGRVMDVNDGKPPSSPPLVEQVPRRSLKESIQRKKEEKAAAMKQKVDVTMADDGDSIVVEKPARVKTPVKTYGKIKRSKTSVASGSPAVAEASKRSADDSSLDRQKKRKLNAYVDEQAPYEFPQAKRYHRSKSITASPGAHGESVAPAEVVDLSSSQVDPVDQVPHTIVTPTASMPKPLLKSSTDTTVLVPATKSQDKSFGSTAPNGEASVDSNGSIIVDSNVSVVKATKSSGSKESSIGHCHLATPKLCFDSSQEKAEAASSVLKKVTELVNSPAAPAPGQTSNTSSPLAISFDKGLVGRSMVLVPEPTGSQKEHYQAVSVSSDDGHVLTASLPAVMSAAKVEKWSGVSSTVLNSTWKDRNSGGDSGQKRAPSMEPLSSQPQPSSRRPIKRSKTVTESTTPMRRGRSASVHCDAPPSSGDADIVAKPGRKKIGRSKTMASGDDPAKSSSQLRKTHVVKTITTYEKLKDPDESVPSFPDADPGTDVKIADTQAGSARGTKRKSVAADLDVIRESQLQKGHERSQEELDMEMARKLQEEMDKEDAEPETRARRRGAPSPKVVDPEPESLQSSQDAGLPPPDMYKPRLSSRRSKSLSAKADPNAVETFIHALPRPGRKGKGKKATNEQAIAPEESKAAQKENVEPTKEAAAINLDAGGDIVMEDVDTIVVYEAPKSFSSMDKPVEDIEAPAKVDTVPKKIGRPKSKSSAPAATAVQGQGAAAEVVAPKKGSRAAKAVSDDTNGSGDELMMDVDEEPAKPKATARGRGAGHNTAASITASANVAPKSQMTVDSEDDDDDEDMPIKPTGKSGRAKATEKPPSAKTGTRSKEVVDTDDDQDEDEAAVSEPASPVKAPAPAPASKPAAIAPTPLPKPRGITRQKSTPGFKAPTLARNKSTSVETDVPQTPRKDKETKGSQESTPKRTPPGTVPHSPLRGGVVPLRVGLSKRTRLPSLLKIIRKDK